VIQTGNIYTDLAEYYDQFCAEVDYVEQCNFAVRVFLLFANSTTKNYLDLACGTGQHLQMMAAHGFTPAGLDNSSSMLARAAERCPAARLLLCDLAAFDEKPVFDLVTCFLYSIHYSHPLSSLRQTLIRTWRALRPGGVFIFNVVDARGIRNGSGITTQLKDGDSRLTFQSGWHYAGTGEVLDLHLTITRESAAGREEWSDHHTMTAITVRQLQSMLEDIGFEVTILEHDYAVITEWRGASFNIIFAACKPCGKE
jgi:SAM-dependent methyltransferase